MSRESVLCNRCGTSLDVAPAARYITCRSCGASLAVQRSDTTAWTEAVSSGSAGDGDRLDRLEDNVQHLSVRSELEQLDSQWERERQEYMTTNKYGVRSVPNKTASLVMGIIGVGFGTIWTLMAVSMTVGSRAAFANAPEGFGPPPFLDLLFPLFGLGFIGLGGFLGYYTYKQAEKYEQAKQRYDQKRAAIEAKLQ